MVLRAGPADMGECAGFSGRSGVAAVDAYTADLAVGIAAIVLTVDPEVVVLGGGLWRASDLLLEPLRKHLEPLCLVMPRLEVSSLGDRSAALGAARVALMHLEERLYDPDTALPVPPGTRAGKRQDEAV